MADYVVAEFGTFREDDFVKIGSGGGEKMFQEDDGFPGSEDAVGEGTEK